MEVVGWVALAAVAVVLVGGVVVGLVNIPDARRYMKIRRM